MGKKKQHKGDIIKYPIKMSYECEQCDHKCTDGERYIQIMNQGKTTVGFGIVCKDIKKIN